MISTTQLRGARAMLGWTSGELARRSKIHRRTIRKVEKGEARPQSKTLACIVAALAAGGIEFREGGVRLNPVNAKMEFSNSIKRGRRKRPFWNFS